MLNAAEVSILIKAHDAASKVLQGVSAHAEKLGGVLKTVGKVGALALGGIAVAAAGMAVKGIAAASNLNEVLSKSNTVFKENAAQVRKWAATSATSFGQSKKEALEAASSFGNMFIQLGIGKDVAAGMSMQMTELASDFASFHNADITEVLIAQQAAFRGEYDALQRFVPTINAAAVEQRALALTGKTLTKELTLQEKALATQKLMMEGAGDAMGDFDRTSSGLANTQRILGATWEDLQAQLGQLLLPVVTKFAQVLAIDVLPNIIAFVDVIKGGLTGDVAAAAEAFNRLPEPLQKIALWLAENRPQIEDLIGKIENLAMTVRKFSEEVLTGWIIILVALWPKLQDLAKWFEEHEEAVVAVTAAIVALAIIFGSVATAVIAAAAGIGWLTSRINDSIEAGGYWAGVFERGEKMINAAKVAVNFMEDALNGMNGAVTRAGEATNTGLVAALRTLSPLLHGAKDAAYWLKDAFYSVRDAAYAVRDAIKSIPTPKLPDLTPGFSLPSPRGFFAEGGRNIAAGWGIVGERGPEIIHVPGGSDIYSNADSQRMVGRGGRGAINKFETHIVIEGNATASVVEQIKRGVQEAWTDMLATDSFGGTMVNTAPFAS